MDERTTQVDADAVLSSLHEAMNWGDLGGFLACFDENYESEQPVHPDRHFTGRAQVEKNWSSIFSRMPDFHAELVRRAVSDNVCWAEWRWTGTRADGQLMDLRGVTIFGVRDGRFEWGRLYMEYVDASGTGIDSAVRTMAAGASEHASESES